LAIPRAGERTDAMLAQKLGREWAMQGMAFAVQAFVAGCGVLDFLLFHGHNTAALLRFLGI